MPGPELPHLIVCKVAKRVEGDRRNKQSSGYHGDSDPKRYLLCAEQQRAGTYVSRVEKDECRRGDGTSSYVLRLKRTQVAPVRKGSLVTTNIDHKNIERLDGGRSPRRAKAKAKGEAEKFRRGNFVKFNDARIGVVKQCYMNNARKVYDIEVHEARALDDLVLLTGECQICLYSFLFSSFLTSFFSLFLLGLGTEDAALRDAWYDEMVRFYHIEGEEGSKSDDVAAAAAAAVATVEAPPAAAAKEGGAGVGSAAGGAEGAGALSPPPLALCVKPDAKVLVAQGAEFMKKQKQTLKRIFARGSGGVFLFTVTF